MKGVLRYAALAFGLAWGAILVAIATGLAVTLTGTHPAGYATVALLALAAFVVPPIFWGEACTRC
ncbi:hypothetical protein [Cryptosporangium sp. NPDC051539]|uniref:hypothetical protein n=1 Tax=Cryptosporangium sp. NPDC051539 TaxID=3363962 RepID=UPI00378FF707